MNWLNFHLSFHDDKLFDIRFYREGAYILIKVLDLNWFPNLFPRSYEEKVYDFVEKVTHKELDRKCEFIPFP